MTTTISVSGRIATVTTTDRLVAGNTYPVTLALDSEWTGSLFMRVRFGSQYYDIPFASSDTTVNVQFPVGYPEVGIGVFSEALDICSNEVRVRLLRSILEQGVSVVDFDSDLYDQWAGEVSELLCDSDFDAESERPVKNSVITAWKDTVPVDSALVHKAGTEVITGAKTFTSGVTIDTHYMQVNKFKTAQDVTTSYRRLVSEVYDIKDGAESLIASDTVTGQRGNGYNGRIFGVANINRTQVYTTDFRVYTDYSLILTTPYYPTSGGNPTPLTERALVTSGNVAVDPRIVHTTGTETIAGDKTLTGMPTVSGTQATLDMASTTPASTVGWKAQFRYRDQDSLVASTIVMTGEDSTQVETRVYKPDRSNYYWMRHTAYSDHELLTVQPYYPVDGSGNPQPLTAGALVSSGNIAVDPRLVHTTGNETVSGIKAFTNGINAYPVEWHRCYNQATERGKYCIFAKILSNDLGRQLYFEVVQSSNRACAWGRFTVTAARSRPIPVWESRTRNALIDDPTKAGSFFVLVKDDEMFLAWQRQFQYGGMMTRVCMDVLNGNMRSLSDTSSAIQFYEQSEMTVLSSLDGYTVYEVEDNTVDTLSDQTVAGTKTFTSNDYLSKKTPCRQYVDTDTSACYGGVQIRSAYLVTGGTVNRASEFVGIRDNPSNPRTRSKITARAPNGSSDAVLQLVAYDSGTSYAEAPSYTADNTADNKIMTRTMLAQTPTVVHTTGNETIAGTKTFSASTVINRLERGYTLAVIRAGEWCKLYEFPPATYGANIVFSVINFWSLTQFVGAEVRVASGNPPNYDLMGLMYGIGGVLNGKVARRADNTIEVWVQNTLGNGIDISTEITHQRNITPKPIGQIGTMPVVGDTYVDVVDMTRIS